VKKALAHGKHVVCTGAFTEDLSMAGELLQLQQQTGRNVFAGLGSRFLKPARRQRADFQAGMIGELITIESHYHADHRSLPGMPRAAGKSLKWLYGGLSHSVDIVRWYLPNIEEVMGYGMISSTGRKAGLKDEDTMHFIFRAADGRIARVSGSYCSSVQPTQRDSAMTCILRCTGGTSQADCHDLRYTVADRTGKKKVTRWDAAARKPYSRSGSGSREVGAFRHCLDYFADSIEEGFTAYPDMREGIGTIAVLQAMDRSLQTKQPVMVQSILEESGVDRLLQASKTLQWCDLDC
jgi:predicted dehydrogenase